MIMLLCVLVPCQIPADFDFRMDFATGNGPHSAQIADLDGDGDMDIVSADYFSDNVSVLFNDGSGIFSKVGEYQTGEGPRSLFLADVDSDSDIDIITGNYYVDTVSVLKNLGNGTFSSKMDYDVGEGPFSIFLADIGEDANSDLDLITADDQADRISVLENDGTGTFGNRNSYRVGSRPKGVHLADLNGDGYNDIACANWADDSVSVLFNKRDGTFEDQEESQTGSYPRAISLADLNGDDIPDIVTANQHSDSISVLFNNADETFTSKIDYAVGHNPLYVLLGDIDSDGDFDVLTTNLDDDSITILKNDGAGNLGNRIDYITDDGPYSVLFADVNGDSEADLITANNNADTVSVLYSNVPPLIRIIEPDGESDVVNDLYTILWEDFDPYDDATITLYRDDDNKGMDGTEIIGGLSEDNDGIGGRFEWNVSAMPEGEYWIYAKIDDGIFPPVYDYSSGALTINHSIISNTPPTFQIIEPDGESDFADIEFTIMWMDSDPDDDASISLYYDIDNFNFDGELIAEGLGEDADGTSGFYTWNTTDVPEGGYFIYGICDDGTNEPVSRYSSYPVMVNHTQPANEIPFIQLLEPDGEDDYADSEFTITWTDSDPDDDASISLYYDTDSTGYDGVLIVNALSEDANGNFGYYTWNTTAIFHGEFYIYAICDDGNNEPVKVYALNPVIVNHTPENDPPVIDISEPDGETDYANTEYMIIWTDSDTNDDAAISLYYDSDFTGYDGTIIVSDISENEHGNSGVYIWNTSSILEGEYWIYAKITDGSTEVYYNYSTGALSINHSSTLNTPPSFTITEPDGENDYADFEFTILWMDSDPDNDAAISLYYDIDDTGYDGVPIVEGISEDAHGNLGFYSWTTSDISEGKYYLYGVCDDGTNEDVKAYGKFPLIINHSITSGPEPLKNNPPLIQLVEPDSKNDLANTEFMIIWIDSDVDDDARISLYYDSDSRGFDGILIADGLSENEHGNSGMYIWDTTDIPEGEYFIYAIIGDGFEYSRDYSPGALFIDHLGDFNTPPNILLTTPERDVLLVDFNFTIQWVASDPDDDASISLYYDTDQNGYDGTLIVEGLHEDNESFFIWNTTDLPDGGYYVYAEIQDGVNKQKYDYSDGKLILNQSIDNGENGDVEDDGENKGSFISNNQFLVILAGLLILIILYLILRKGAKDENEEDEEDFEESDEDSPSPEGLEGEEIDEQLLPPPDDEDLFPTLEDEELDEESLPPPEDL